MSIFNVYFNLEIFFTLGICCFKI